MTTTKQKKMKDLTAPQKDLDFELFKSLDHARAVLSRAREIEIAQYGATLEQTGLMRTLLEAGGSLTSAEIADSMIRQSNSVTTLVTRMEKLGLVAKQRVGIGTRIVVSITPKGRDIVKKIAFKSIHMAFSDMSLEDKKRLLKYLAHLIDKGRNMLGMNQKLPFLT